MKLELQINPEFEEVIPPAGHEEFKQLEENIVAEGELLMPIIIWNGYIIDGHRRYKILKKHPEIECKTFEKHFEDKYEAIAWICKNQISTKVIHKSVDEMAEQYGFSEIQKEQLSELLYEYNKGVSVRPITPLIVA